MLESETNRRCHQIRKELIAFAKSLGMEANEAEDQVHSALLRILEQEGERFPTRLNPAYLKVMVKNLWLDRKRADKTEKRPNEAFVRFTETIRSQEEELLLGLEEALKEHKYGYIILEMEKRNIRTIKQLAPYVNQKKEKLYNRYQKLVRDLKTRYSLERGYCLQNTDHQ
ncbi:MAG: hypothetical protein ABEH38_07250 [Flavobacteriales bacterium]